MELHEAHEVKAVYSPQEANTAIQQDCWKLLAVTAAHHPDPFNERGDKLQTCYVLGRPKKGGGAYTDGGRGADGCA